MSVLVEPVWKKKTRPCPFYSQGRCFFADSCNFLHEVKITSPLSVPSPLVEYEVPIISQTPPSTATSPSGSEGAGHSPAEPESPTMRAAINRRGPTVLVTQESPHAWKPDDERSPSSSPSTVSSGSPDPFTHYYDKSDGAIQVSSAQELEFPAGDETAVFPITLSKAEDSTLFRQRAKRRQESQPITPLPQQDVSFTADTSFGTMPPTPTPAPGAITVSLPRRDTLTSITNSLSSPNNVFFNSAASDRSSLVKRQRKAKVWPPLPPSAKHPDIPENDDDTTNLPPLDEVCITLPDLGLNATKSSTLPTTTERLESEQALPVRTDSAPANGKGLKPLRLSVIYSSNPLSGPGFPRAPLAKIAPNVNQADNTERSILSEFADTTLVSSASKPDSVKSGPNAAIFSVNTPSAVDVPPMPTLHNQRRKPSQSQKEASLKQADLNSLGLSGNVPPPPNVIHIPSNPSSRKSSPYYPHSIFTPMKDLPESQMPLQTDSPKSMTSPIRTPIATRKPSLPQRPFSPSPSLSIPPSLYSANASPSHPHLFFALASDSPNAVNELLSTGSAHPNDKAGPQDLPALVFALSNDQLKHKTEIVKVLLGHGADASVVEHLVAESSHGSIALNSEGEDDGVANSSDPSPLESRLRESLNPAIRYYLSRQTRNSITQAQALLASTYEPLSRARYNIVGQDFALDELHKTFAARIKRQGPALPLSLIFSGPSGHGKSHLACQVGSLLNAPTHIVHMTNLRSQQDLLASRSITPTPDNDTLVDFLKRHQNQRCVVVLEEIEKVADKAALHSLLMPWELGKISTPDLIDTREVIWICTSNVGEDLAFEFHDQHPTDKVKITRTEYRKLIMGVRRLLADTLGNSLVSRATAILPFLPFTHAEKQVLAYEAFSTISSTLPSSSSLLSSLGGGKDMSNFLDDIIGTGEYSLPREEGARGIHRAVQARVEDEVWEAE